MRFGHRRLLAAVVATVGMVAMGCRSGSPRASGDDSARPAARADSVASPSGPSITRADSVVLRTDKTEYRAGDAMTLTLENTGAAHYTFNPCSRSLEREDGGSWKTVNEEGRMCTMEAWLLEAHATRSGATELPSPLTPGRYRVNLRLTTERADGTGGAVVVTSAPISVR